MIQWSQPVYEAHGPFAYLRAPKAHITPGFGRVAELQEPGGRLTGAGERMQHLRYASPASVDVTEVATWVHQC